MKEISALQFFHVIEHLLCIKLCKARGSRKIQWLLLLCIFLSPLHCRLDCPLEEGRTYSGLDWDIKLLKSVLKFFGETVLDMFLITYEATFMDLWSSLCVPFVQLGVDCVVSVHCTYFYETSNLLLIIYRQQDEHI